LGEVANIAQAISNSSSDYPFPDERPKYDTMRRYRVMVWDRLLGWPGLDWRGPFAELERLRREMDRLYTGFAGGAPRTPAAGVFPLLNVTEDKDAYYLRAELPGIKAEDLEISVTGNGVSIGGERTLPIEEAGAKYHRREREAGTFSRMITLPMQIDTQQVEAQSKDGILTVVLPKSESAKPKQIPIKKGK
jgi:HSP20 family protein